jgi:hypothetical protein
MVWRRGEITSCFVSSACPIPCLQQKRPGPHWKMPLLAEREERGARERPTLPFTYRLAKGKCQVIPYSYEFSSWLACWTLMQIDDVCDTQISQIVLRATDKSELMDSIATKINKDGDGNNSLWIQP